MKLTPKERFAETKKELLEKVNSAVAQLENRHTENPEDWSPISDLDDLATAVNNAIADCDLG